MKKFASILAVAALSLGGVALGAAPAMAQPVPPPVLSATPSIIESGGALTVDFSLLGTSLPNSCMLFKQDAVVVQSVDATDLAAFAGQLPSGGVFTAPAGDPSYGYVNQNETAVAHTYSLAVYTVAGGLCSNLNPASLPTPDYYTQWTINPALTVAAIAPFTTGVAASEIPATSLSNPTAGPLDAALASSWSISVGDVCPVPLLTNANPNPTYVALPAGLGVDETVSAAGVVPALTISGTPAAGTAGDYQICLTLTDSNGNRVGAITTITVADPAPVVAELAKTGVDGMQDGALAGGAALVVLLGAAAFVLVRRRTAAV
jgi:LPXTG-motif cell wall-anchored protein